MNNVGKITQFTFIDNNFKQKCNKYDKNAHKLSVMYFKGGSVYFLFHLSFLVGKAFNVPVTIWISRRRKKRL